MRDPSILPVTCISFMAGTRQALNKQYGLHCRALVCINPYFSLENPLSLWISSHAWTSCHGAALSQSLAEGDSWPCPCSGHGCWPCNDLMAACLLQNAEGFRKRALEGVRVITYLQEFANAGSLSQLSDLFQDDNRLAEAAVQPCPS